MRRLIGGVLTATFVLGCVGVARARDNDAGAVVDKAIKALGGEEKLSAVKATTTKGKGKISIGGSDNDFSNQSTVQDLDHVRSEFEGDFMGNKIKGATVLAGDKGWRQFSGMTNELDKDALANEKRNVYLQVIPTMPTMMKGKGFKFEAAPEEKIGEKAAVGIKVIGPDGKDFKVYFDKETGLPVRLVAKVVGFQGDEATQETNYSDYKDFDGIKRPTKTEVKRDGEKFMTMDLTEFKVLDSVPANTFAEPKDS